MISSTTATAPTSVEPTTGVAVDEQHLALLDSLRAKIRDVPNFPKPGIMFKDITPLLSDGVRFRRTIDLLAEPLIKAPVDLIVGIESRGFLFASALAYRLERGVVPIRKPGKLPHRSIRETYDLEYGTDCLEIHEDAVRAGTPVAIVDDVLATGGTALAAAKLIERRGGIVRHLSFVLELGLLRGRERLGQRPIHALLAY
jgi:adenine phosphoribosyltransferase